MSVFLKFTIEVDPARLEEFFEVQEKYLIPVNESLGLRLQGIFTEILGSVKPAIVEDLWEAESLEHVARIQNEKRYLGDPRWMKYVAVAKEVILTERLSIMKKIFGRMPCVYESSGEDAATGPDTSEKHMFDL